MRMAKPLIRRFWPLLAGPLAAFCVWLRPAPAGPAPASTPPPAGERIDFDRDIRPILSDKCYFCHGPDEKARKAKLRLDMKDGPQGAYRVKDDVVVIVPGKSGDSELIRRIVTDDVEDKMPPPKSNRT